MEPPPAGPAPAPTWGSGDCWLAAPSWTASTNWKVSRGSLQDSISFETSASILEEGGGEDVGAVSVSRGMLLTRPAGQESAPCEITICFRKRHEIHRIYVQSTARVYEVYYSSEWQGRGNEYLCTVRCGASEKEVFLPTCDSEKAVVDSLKDSSSSEEVHAKMTTCESNTSGEEDGWVEVKIPDSPLLGGQRITFPKKPDRYVVGNSQICYEATADISDASPCTSLILRLLSLQTKDCIHIEEIYVYADPVESTDSNSAPSMTGSIAGNSLLAMLVPSVLQLSKAGSSKVQDITVLSSPSVQKRELDASMVTKEMDSQIARTELKESFTTVVEKEQVLAQTMVNERIEKVDSDVPSQHHVLESVPAKGDITHGHLEKILDQLVSRVGSIEASLSRFEANVLKPLNCIDTRLQRVEHQLDALSSRSASSKPFQYSRFSAPEFQAGDCDSDEGSDVADMVKEDATVDSPDVVKEDTTVNSPSVVKEDATVDPNVEDKPDGSVVSSFTDGVMFVPASDMCPGLFIKAPDFVNEEDEHVSSNDISESASLSCPKAKASSSIDDALSSALKAFMLSTSTNSRKSDIPSVPESQSSNVAVDYSLLAANVGTCETSKISGFNETDGICSTNVDQRSDIMFKEGEAQQTCHQKWHLDSFGGLAKDDVSETDENENGSRKGVDNDSNLDEAPNEVSHLIRACRIWNEDSSSDSNFDENVNETNQNMNLLDVNSTDSENEPYALRNWLSGRQDDFRFQEDSFLGTMDCNEMNTEVSDESVRCNQNTSKVEIQKALNSCQNDTDTDDSEEPLRCTLNMSTDGMIMSLNSSEGAEVLGPSLNEESSLLDVQFVQLEKSNYAFQLGGLMRDMLDSETEGSDWLNYIGAREHSHSPLLKTAWVDAPVTVNDPFIDLEVAVKSSEFRTEGSSNEQLFSSLI